MELFAQTAENAVLGGIDGIGADSQLGGDVGSGAAARSRLPARLPNHGGKLRLHQLQGAAGEEASIFLLGEDIAVVASGKLGHLVGVELERHNAAAGRFSRSLLSVTVRSQARKLPRRS